MFIEKPGLTQVIHKMSKLLRNLLHAWNIAFISKYFLTYWQEHGTGVSFTVTCPKNKFCESHIMMTHGEVKIPYEIIAYTKGEKDDTCSEKGVVTVSNSWQATITNAAYDSK